MRNRVIIIVVAVIGVLASCQTYTTKSALGHITVPTADSDRIQTKYSTIVEDKEAELQRQRELSAQEQVALLSEEITSLEAAIASYKSVPTLADLSTEIAEEGERLVSFLTELTELFETQGVTLTKTQAIVDAIQRDTIEEFFSASDTLIAEAVEEIAALRSFIETVELEWIPQLEAQIALQQQEILALEEALAASEASIAALLESSSQEKERAQEQIARLTRELEGRATEDDVTYWFEQIASLEEELRVADMQIEEASDEITHLQTLIDAYQNTEIPSLEAQILALSTELAESTSTIETLTEERAHLRAELAERASDEDVSRWHTQIVSLEEELQIALTEAEETADEITLLQNLIDAYQDTEIPTLEEQILVLTTELAESTSTIEALVQDQEHGRAAYEEHISLLLAELAERASDEDVTRWYTQITTLETSLASARAEVADADRKIATLTATIEGLKAEKLSLVTESDRLAGELAEVSATLVAEQTLLGQYRAERQAEEQLRKALEKAEQDRLEREQFLASQIPALDKLKVPHRYSVVAEQQTLEKGAVLRTLFLPLGDVVWQNSATAAQVVHSISDLSYPILFVTGAMENVVATVRALQRNAVLLEGGAIITNFAVEESSAHSIRITINEEQSLRLSLANLVEREVFAAFFDAEADWQGVQKAVTPEREEALLTIAQAGSLIDPTLVAASLYEPSHQDWSVFSPIAYRQTDYLWPLVAAMEEEGFYDTYRITHFAAETDSGNTYYSDRLAERFDFIFARKVLPLETAVLPIGALSAADEARWAILASFLIP